MKNRLSEIKNRLEAATPGPWYPGFAWPNAIYKNKALTKQLGTVGKNSHINDENGKIDAEFIANAPQDISDLLAVVEVYKDCLTKIEVELGEDDDNIYIAEAREALTKAHEILSSSES